MQRKVSLRVSHLYVRVLCPGSERLEDPRKKTKMAMPVKLSAQRNIGIARKLNSQRVRNVPRCNAHPASACSPKLSGAICAGGLALLVAMTPAFEARAEVRLPPLDTDPQRCERGYVRNESFPARCVSFALLLLSKL